MVAVAHQVAPTGSFSCVFVRARKSARRSGAAARGAAERRGGRYATPRMGGWWNVSPKVRSDAPTRSRYGVAPPIWKG
jgi:hypothetical protein